LRDKCLPIYPYALNSAAKSWVCHKRPSPKLAALDNRPWPTGNAAAIFRAKPHSDEVWLLSGEHANARGPLNTYLSRPIRHVAVFDWPRNAQALNAALPRTYIAITAEYDDIFAFRVVEDIQDFKIGTILAFTRDYDATRPGVFLDISDDSCALSDTHSDETMARLIYSFTPH